MRKHNLMYILSAIILLNIVAIVILSNNVVEEQPSLPERIGKVPEVQQETTSPAIAPETPETPEAVIAEKQESVAHLQEVKVLLLENPDDCPDCYDIQQYVDALSDVMKMSVAEGDPNSFKPPRLPALAFSQDIEAYPHLIENWEPVGYTTRVLGGEHEGLWYVLPGINPPYYEVSSGSVRGRVTVTYVTMDSCIECYDVYSNRASLAESRITPYQEIIVDINSPEGRLVQETYGITQVPTILLSPDAREYTNFIPGWDIVGSVEDDGVFVLRDLQKLKVTYYDLAKERVMSP